MFSSPIPMMVLCGPDGDIDGDTGGCMGGCMGGGVGGGMGGGMPMDACLGLAAVLGLVNVRDLVDDRDLADGRDLVPGLGWVVVLDLVDVRDLVVGLGRLTCCCLLVDWVDGDTLLDRERLRVCRSRRLLGPVSYRVRPGRWL
jgi:hypothetical protein